MPLSINANTPSSINTRQQFNRNQAISANGRPSSGIRINSAADDSAGLGVSEKLRAQTRSLAQADRNTQSGITGLRPNGSDLASPERNIAPRVGASNSSFAGLPTGSGVTVSANRAPGQALETANETRRNAVQPPIPEPEPGPSVEFRGARVDFLA